MINKRDQFEMLLNHDEAMIKHYCQEIMHAMVTKVNPYFHVDQMTKLIVGKISQTKEDFNRLLPASKEITNGQS